MDINNITSAINNISSNPTPTDIMSIALLSPIVGIFFIYLFKKYKNIREAITIITAIFTFANIFQLLFSHLQGESISLTVLNVTDNISIAFEVTSLGLIFAIVASFLWIITSVYAIGYMRNNNEKGNTRFFIMFALSIFAALSIALSANLFTMFIFYELLSLATYPLVTHGRDEDSKKSGRTYLGILMGTSICFFLPAIIITYSIAGHLNFTQGGVFTDLNIDPTIIPILIFLFVYGIGKAALMPIHRWLPVAMVAPTPVSALLHAVAVVKSGVFCIVKVVVYILGVDYISSYFSGEWWQGSWVMYMAGFTILLASIVALKQDNLKKRLAYSTISQLSYVIMATFILAKESIIAASFHIAAHAFGKITLFFAAGSIYTASKKKYVSQLNGIGRRMPWTMGAFTIGAFSMIGIPPTAGFITKWYMLSGAVDKNIIFVVAVLIISTVLNASYFLPIIYSAFFKKEDAGNKDHGEAPFTLVYPLAVTAAITIWLFFMPDIFFVLSESVLP